MTHLTSDLNRLCRCWCPIIGECPSDHYCRDMDEIRKRILHISEFEQVKLDE